jgi:hypothetical protein
MGFYHYCISEAALRKVEKIDFPIRISVSVMCPRVLQLCDSLCTHRWILLHHEFHFDICQPRVGSSVKFAIIIAIVHVQPCRYATVLS